MDLGFRGGALNSPARQGTHIALKKEGTLEKTRGGCRFPIKNVGRLQGKNEERGVSSFSKGIERFWQKFG